MKMSPIQGKEYRTECRIIPFLRKDGKGQNDYFDGVTVYSYFRKLKNTNLTSLNNIAENESKNKRRIFFAPQNSLDFCSRPNDNGEMAG